MKDSTIALLAISLGIVAVVGIVAMMMTRGGVAQQYAPVRMSPDQYFGAG